MNSSFIYYRLPNQAAHRRAKHIVCACGTLQMNVNQRSGR